MTKVKIHVGGMDGGDEKERKGDYMQKALEAEPVSLLHKLLRQQLHVSALQLVTTSSSLAVRKL